MVAVLFWIFVFKPLMDKNKQLEQDVQQAVEQEQIQEEKASHAAEVTEKEVQTKAQLSKILARFYPMLQSQDAENMATTLALNHNLTIQSMTVAMPEAEVEPLWYQYSANADSPDALPQPEAEEQTATETLPLYVARVTCVAEGEEEDLWGLIDDISLNYPAISMMNAEWSVVETPVSVTVPVEGYVSEESTEGEEDTQESSEAQVSRMRTVTETVRTNRVIITMEIYMCKQ